MTSSKVEARLYRKEYFLSSIARLVRFIAYKIESDTTSQNI
ncbi:hypothetical protein [Helicobacter typhlonius]